MYSPRLSVGLASATVAFIAGKRTISPSVQTMTVPTIGAASRQNAIAPKPIPIRTAPSASARRCGQWEVATESRTSNSTIRTVFTVNSAPKNDFE